MLPPLTHSAPPPHLLAIPRQDCQAVVMMSLTEHYTLELEQHWSPAILLLQLKGPRGTAIQSTPAAIAFLTSASFSVKSWQGYKSSSRVNVYSLIVALLSGFFQSRSISNEQPLTFELALLQNFQQIIRQPWQILSRIRGELSKHCCSIHFRITRG